MKKFTLLFLMFLLVSCSNENQIPIPDGSYVFEHKYAEHPKLKSITFDVKINGSKIIVINNNESKTWPKGSVEEGQLFLHSSKKWIIVHNQTDETAEEVGGCTGGPTVIDLVQKIYWTC